MKKRVTIYSKNGNAIEVLASCVQAFLNNGYTQKPKDSKKENRKVKDGRD